MHIISLDPNNRFRIWLLVAIIAILLLASGCQEMGGEAPTTHNGNGGTGYGPEEGDLAFRPVALDQNASGFYFRTDVGLELHHQNERTFDDVMFCLYDQNGTVLNSKNIGQFKGPKDYKNNVSITADQSPKYMIVHHPDFADYPEFDLNVFIRENGNYREQSIFVGELNETVEFDYKVPMEGECSSG